jgi:hypothetical protein
VLLGDELVEKEQQRGRRVDRHRGRDLAERDPIEEQLHVGDRVDRHPGAADLPHRSLVIRVVPELGRQVERNGDPVLAAGEQVPEARVRLFRRGEAGVLADRPRTAAVHVGVRAACERELARRLELEPGDVRVGINRLDLDSRVGLAPVGGGGHPRLG